MNLPVQASDDCALWIRRGLGTGGSVGNAVVDEVLGSRDNAWTVLFELLALEANEVIRLELLDSDDVKFVRALKVRDLGREPRGLDLDVSLDLPGNRTAISRLSLCLASKLSVELKASTVV